jgi:hypothetical protein
MVFFGSFWKDTVPVRPVLEALFSKDHRKEFDAYVRFTEDADEAVEFLNSFKPPHANLTIASLASKSTAA